MIVIAQQGETVDELCNRVLGFTDGITEQVLQQNNLSRDPILEPGQKIKIPDFQQQTTENIQLWD